jgi:hypothetical protein
MSSVARDAVVATHHEPEYVLMKDVLSEPVSFAIVSGLSKGLVPLLNVTRIDATR